MALTIDENDPCAAAVALRGAYAKLVAGQASMIVTFKAGASGVERSVTFHKAHPDRLLMLVREYEAKCAQAQGRRPTRFAIGTGGVR